MEMIGCGLPEAQQLAIKSSPTFTEDDRAVVKLKIRGETVKQSRNNREKRVLVLSCGGIG